MTARQDPLERRIHLDVVQLLRLTARTDVVWYHNANERRCSPKEGAFLKRMGVLAGVPDFTIITFPSRASYLEIKRPGNRLTEAQELFRERVEALGCRYEIAHSLSEAQIILTDYGAIKPDRNQSSPLRKAA